MCDVAVHRRVVGVLFSFSKTFRRAVCGASAVQQPSGVGFKYAQVYNNAQVLNRRQQGIAWLTATRIAAGFDGPSGWFDLSFPLAISSGPSSSLRFLFGIIVDRKSGGPSLPRWLMRYPVVRMVRTCYASGLRNHCGQSITEVSSNSQLHSVTLLLIRSNSGIRYHLIQSDIAPTLWQTKCQTVQV